MLGCEDCRYTYEAGTEGHMQLWVEGGNFGTGIANGSLILFKGVGEGWDDYHRKVGGETGTV